MSRIAHLPPGMTIHMLVSSGLGLVWAFFFPLACSLPSHFMLRFLMLSTNCNVQGTTANLPNVFHQTRCKKKKISEGSQDTFTCQATNVKALQGSRGCKLWGLIHNHSAAKTFSTDASGQHICQYEGFWHVLITGVRYVMMMLLGEEVILSQHRDVIINPYNSTLPYISFYVTLSLVRIGS